MEREIHENVVKRVQFVIPNLENFFERLEKKWETDIIDLFKQVEITAIVKSDKYSLPYQGEVVVKCHCESYINAMYNRSTVFRPILKEMLEKNATKVRFYIHIETYDDKRGGLFGALIGSGFKYSFRYYLH
jgi:hypothetical protein